MVGWGGVGVGRQMETYLVQEGKLFCSFITTLSKLVVFPVCPELTILATPSLAASPAGPIFALMAAAILWLGCGGCWVEGTTVRGDGGLGKLRVGRRIGLTAAAAKLAWVTTGMAGCGTAGLTVASGREGSPLGGTKGRGVLKPGRTWGTWGLLIPCVALAPMSASAECVELGGEGVGDGLNWFCSKRWGIYGSWPLDGTWEWTQSS